MLPNNHMYFLKSNLLINFVKSEKVINDRRSQKEKKKGKKRH